MCDSFAVTTATLRTDHVLFVIEVRTRRIVFWNVTERPGGVRVAQQFRNLSILCGELPRHLLHDRDGKSSSQADALLRSQVTKPIRLPVWSPNLNAHAERLIRSVREQCADRVVVLNEPHLR